MFDKTALWFKRMEILALKRKRQGNAVYFDGKAQAFSEAWEYVVFGTIADPIAYNKENDRYSVRVNVLFPETRGED